NPAASAFRRIQASSSGSNRTGIISVFLIAIGRVGFYFLEREGANGTGVLGHVENFRLGRKISCITWPTACYLSDLHSVNSITNIANSINPRPLQNHN